jgi:hypothetical protein
VGFQHARELAGLRFHGRLFQVHAGIVYQDRDRAVFFGDAPGKDRAALALRHVVHHPGGGAADAGAGVAQHRFAPPGKDDARSGVDELAGDRQPESGSATGDEREFAGEREGIVRHGIPPRGPAPTGACT